jgi:two-component sensor histidine kinase
VRDDGVELPADFDIKKSKGLGMRIVAALSEQLGASITQHSCENGKEFAVLFPCDIVEPIQVERKTAVSHAANHGSPPRS